jgi:serine/threonine protein kinase
MLKGICNGLIPLLKEGYVHRYIYFNFRDIKPHNILILKGRPKISDFGYARHKHSDHNMDSVLGTPIY